MIYAPSKDSDQPVHPPSLIRVFAVRMNKTWMLSYLLSAQRRLWSGWAHAQVDLSRCWAHMSFCWYWHAAAYIYSSNGHFLSFKWSCFALTLTTTVFRSTTPSFWHAFTWSSLNVMSKAWTRSTLSYCVHRHDIFKASVDDNDFIFRWLLQSHETCIWRNAYFI